MSLESYLVEHRQLLIKAIDDVREHLPPEIVEYAERRLSEVSDLSIERADELLIMAQTMPDDVLKRQAAVAVRGLQKRLTTTATTLEGAWIDAMQADAWEWIKDKLQALLQEALRIGMSKIREIGTTLLVEAIGKTVEELAGRK